MQERTTVLPKASPAQIGFQEAIVAMGSCFAEAIAHRFRALSFPVEYSPFGTTFHPLMLAKHLDRAADVHEHELAQGILQRDGLYFHWDAYTKIYGRSKEELLAKLKEDVQFFHQSLLRCDWLLLTFGTSHGYRLQSNVQLVNNCHKQPAHSFQKHLFDIQEMYEGLSHSLRQWQARNPKLKIILTVSPVRHTRDGMVSNTRSKARLVELCHLLAQALAATHYFPSYEIMLDELRDYRYYAPDLVHPSPQAEDVIWERLKQVHMCAETQAYCAKVEAINKELAHELLFPEAESTPRFLASLKEKINQFPYPLPVQSLAWEKKWQAFQDMNPKG